MYIHIPFCVKKCGYCGFCSFEGRGEETMERYARDLTRELLMYRERQIEIDTIFIGGGTPSLLPKEHIGQILEAAEAAFSVKKDAEITMEANPGTLSEEKLVFYREAGVNRLSIGAQSMSERLLRLMGRIHDRRAFLENYRAARRAGFENINVDLMLGMPAQSMGDWKDSLREVLELAPEHISFYSLQLEEGTEFCGKYKNGELDLPPEETERAMYHEGIRMLKEAGYRHYEISNCARPGFECRHNLKYWNFDEYLAAGLAAHSFEYEKGRRSNVTDLDRYWNAIEAGRPAADDSAYEEETMRDYMGEYVFTALRRAEGVDLADFRKTFGIDFGEAYGGCMETLRHYESRGLIKLEKDRMKLTEKGIDCSNSIMAEFV